MSESVNFRAWARNLSVRKPEASGPALVENLLLQTTRQETLLCAAGQARYNRLNNRSDTCVDSKQRITNVPQPTQRTV